ncbi:hypothetical protein [Streptomyces cyaneofuscatus]|uniref:hypothetical protein n=1 Tax=Streptomyces cyaneofuscatus TaxID=66883 RepID=UPI0033A0A657
MTTTSDSFRFSCEKRPHGRYTFTLKATDVRLGHPGLPPRGTPGSPPARHHRREHDLLTHPTHWRTAPSVPTARSELRKAVRAQRADRAA